MEIQLISGRFTPEEAEQLLTGIVKVKIAFHEQKIKTVHVNEEDIEHSEKRILQLEKYIRDIAAKIRSGGKEQIDIHAHIEISLAPRLM